MTGHTAPPRSIGVMFARQYHTEQRKHRWTVKRAQHSADKDENIDQVDQDAHTHMRFGGWKRDTEKPEGQNDVTCQTVENHFAFFVMVYDMAREKREYDGRD